jgi:hypothetical protein
MNWQSAGGWLDRRRIGLAAGLLLVLQLGGFAFIVAGTHGWIVPLSGPTTTDFVSFYAAGDLANAGTPALAYDQVAHLAAEERVVGAGIGYQYFNYPPVFLLLCSVLARLPYLLAFVLFETATLLLFVAAATRILGDRSAGAVAVLLAFPIVFWNYGLGQNAFLTAGLFGLATFLTDRRPLLAGVLFGLTCYKPQFGLLLPLAFVVGGYWRVFAGAALSVLVLVAASLALFGIETWQAFLATIGHSPTMYASGRILFAGMANAFGAVRMLGGPPALAYSLQALVSLIAAAIVIWVWRRRSSLPNRAAVLTAAALVAAPLTLFYDLMLSAIAGAWLLRRDGEAAAGWEKVAIAALYLILLDGRGLAEGVHVPVFPLAGLAVLAVATARAWREPGAAPASLPAQLCGNRISSRW